MMGAMQPQADTDAMDIWRELLAVARWAPSPHNTQPWKVRVLDDRNAELFMVRSRRLPDEDTTGCFLLCAMGIFIEAMRIAARNRSLRLDVASTETPDYSRELIPFAKLTLGDGERNDEYPDSVMLERRTSRLAPSAERVTGREMEMLRAAGAEFGHEVHGTADAGMIRRVLDRNIEAVMHDLSDAKYGGEIARWYRYTSAQGARSKDGLESRCMNMPGHEMWISARARWMLRTPGLSGAMRRAYRARLGGATQMIFLRGAFFERHAAEKAGRMLLRLWLRMHTLGLGMHPFGNLVTNAGAHAWLTEAMGLDKIWLVARVGRTAIPPRSHRLDTEDLLCTDS